MSLERTAWWQQDWMGIIVLCLLAVWFKLLVFQLAKIDEPASMVRDIAWSGLGFYTWMVSAKRLPTQFASWSGPDAVALIYFLSVFLLSVVVSGGLETAPPIWAILINGAGQVVLVYGIPCFFYLR